MTRRLVAFAVLCLALATIGHAYLSHFGTRPPATSDSLPVAVDPDALARIRSGPHLLFRTTAQHAGYGRVALAALDALDERVVTDLACDRIHFAAGQGICLAAERGVLTTYEARLFDAGFTEAAALPIAGPPSRARVSPDGRHVAFTVFESGHSYAAASFSTRTTLVDTRTASPLGDLEQWEVLRDGEPWRELDFNFWGVTFAPDGDRFYATLATGEKILLVEGSILKRQMRVVREGVECPSLSPDGRRLVFKSRRVEGGRQLWGLRVLDLATGDEVFLDGEMRSVDDQAVWLDDRHVLYGLPEDQIPSTGGSDLWLIETRAGAAPRKLLEQASSPAVVR